MIVAFPFNKMSRSLFLVSWVKYLLERVPNAAHGLPLLLFERMSKAPKPVSHLYLGVQNTLKAVSRLLSGELTHTSLMEHCVRQDGTAGYFRCDCCLTH